jgi:hypothetical protein
MLPRSEEHPLARSKRSSGPQQQAAELTRDDDVGARPQRSSSRHRRWVGSRRRGARARFDGAADAEARRGGVIGAVRRDRGRRRRFAAWSEAVAAPPPGPAGRPRAGARPSAGGRRGRRQWPAEAG